MLPNTFSITGDVIETSPGTYSFAATNSYNNYVATAAVDWTNQESMFEIVSFPDTVGAKFTMEARSSGGRLELTNHSTQGRYMNYYAGTTRVGGGPHDFMTTPFWKIGYTTTEMYFMNSADGKTWTEVARGPVTPPTSTTNRFSAYNSVAGTDRVVARSLNTPPPSNTPPTAAAGTDQTVKVGSPVNVTGSGTDDVGITSYDWAFTTKPTDSVATLAGTDQTRTFTPDKAGLYTLRLTTTDAGGLTATDDVNITAELTSNLLTWDPAPAGEAALARYEIQGLQGDQVALNTSVTPDVLSYTHVQAPAGVVYIVRAVDVNEVAGEWSEAKGLTGVDVVVNNDIISTTGDELTWTQSAGWQTSAGGEHYSSTVGAWRRLHLKGTRFRLFGTKDVHHGDLTVKVDGGAAQTFSAHATARAREQLLADITFADGTHVVEVGVPTTGTVAIDYAIATSTGLQSPPAPIEEPVAPAGVLWEADFSQTSLAAAMEFKNVSSPNAQYGSLAAEPSSPDGSGKVFRMVIPANDGGASDGYRAFNELALAAPNAGFQHSELLMEEHFRVKTIGGMQVTDCKVGTGITVAPPGAADLSAFSTGGTKKANSATERLTLVPAGYVQSGHPWCGAYYLYAHHAGGQTYSQWGLRKVFRDPNGNTWTPVEGQWYKFKRYYKANDPGVNNGVFKLWIDDVLYVNLTDVRWNETGEVKFGYILAQSFANNNITSSAVIEVSEPRVSAPQGGEVVLIDQDFSKTPDTENYINSDNNTGPWPWKQGDFPWYKEWDGLTNLHIRGGRLVKTDNTEDYHRLYFKHFFEKPLGKIVTVEMFDAKGTPGAGSTGSHPGLKVSPTYPDPANPYKNEVGRGVVNQPDPYKVASLQCFTGITKDGKLEVSNQVWGTGYRFSPSNPSIGYANETVYQLKTTFEFFSNSHVRTRQYINGVLRQEWDDTAYPIGAENGFFMRWRTDDGAWSCGRIRITEAPLT